jgi:C1A family cysteine protease
LPNLERKYNVKPDRVDWRDKYYNFARTPLRDSVDLRPWESDVKQQAQLGSCSSQAVCSAYELLIKRDYPGQFKDLSRLFVYYNAREIERSITEDAGVYVRDAIKAVNRYGVCSDYLWPYEIKNFTKRPSDISYADGRTRMITHYYRLTNVWDILDALNSNYPVVAGLTVYAGFNGIGNNNPVLPIPTDSEEELGAHAVLFVGYNFTNRLILARNSFGPEWGDHGHFWIPFEYLQRDLTDAWIFDIKLS